MMAAFESLQAQRDAVYALAQQYGVGNIRVFGSVAKGNETPKSDIDFLVTLEEGRSLKDSILFKVTLREMLHRKVDVVLEESLPRYVRQRILNECKPL